MTVTLKELPPPPPDRVGWPWTEGSAPLPLVMPDGAPWPRITVVTPSFNQANFVEATIRSILLQGYPNLEYFVLDGGSADASASVISKYAPWLSYWTSERDGGQSAAINRGLRLGTGTFATWINSDDMLHQNALVTQAARVGFSAETVYVGDCLYINEHQQALNMHRARVQTFEDLVRVRTVWRARGRRGHIVQPEVLFPREMALELGALDVNNHNTMDYELWGKFLLAGAAFCYTHIPFGIFRLHGAQKTAQSWATTRSLVRTAIHLVEGAAALPGAMRESLVADLRDYERDYWRDTGPLARLGLPESAVLCIRDLETSLRIRVSRAVRRYS